MCYDERAAERFPRNETNMHLFFILVVWYRSRMECFFAINKCGRYGYGPARLFVSAVLGKAW